MTSPPSPAAGGKRAWLTLILLILVFAGPMIAAWIAVQDEDLRPGRSSVKGHLMQPARPVSLAMLKGLDGAVMTPEPLRGHWLLLYIGDSTCGEVCRRSLYHMRQTRLAVGEDTHRVRRLLVLTDGTPSPSMRELLASHQGLAVATVEPGTLGEFLTPFHVTAGDDPVREQRIYILDPLGNLVLVYGPDAEPKGMLEDLERLLKASQIG